MAHKGEEPEVVVRVTHVKDPEQARAALAILKEGLRRRLVELLCSEKMGRGAPATRRWCWMWAAVSAPLRPPW